MIGINELLPTEVGIDIAGTDLNEGVFAQQIAIEGLTGQGIGVLTKYQPISIIGNIYIYDPTTGDLKFTLLRQSIQGYHTILLSDGIIGDICYVQYRF